MSAIKSGSPKGSINWSLEKDHFEIKICFYNSKKALD